MMCGALIGPLRVFPCFNTSSKMVNAVTLKLSDLYLSVNFETIS